MTVSELRILVDNLDEYIHIPGGIDRLKKMVLHLAVSGQLVPQDPSEGTGEELYWQIQAEKSELVKQGKLKKQKELPEISNDEIPFVIPDSWRWVRLGSVFAFINGDRGKNYPSKDKLSENGDIPFLSAINLQNKKISSEKLLFLSPEQFDALGSGKVRLNDLVICIRGSLGKFAISNFNTGAIASSLVILRNYTSYISSVNFTAHYLETPLFNLEIKRYDNGTAQPNLSASDLMKFALPLPPYAEQKRIVAKVDSIFKLIDQLAKAYKSEQTERSKLVASSLGQLAKGEDGVEGSVALTHLPEIIRTKADAKVLRQTILHLAVSGQLVPQDPSEGTGEELYRKIQSEKAVLVKQGKIKKQKTPPEINEDKAPFIIPSNWKWVRTGEVVNVNSGTSYSKKDLDPNGIRILRGGNVVDGLPLEAKDDDVFVSSALKDERKKVSIGDVVIVASTGSMTAIGKPSIVDRDMDAYIGAFLRILRAHNIVDRDYFWIYIQSDLYRSYIRSKVQGTNINNIKNEYITENMFPLAPLEEQKRIVAKTTQLLNLVTELEEHLVD